MINRHNRLIRIVILLLVCSGAYTSIHAETIPAIPKAVGTVEIEASIRYAAWLSLENSFDNFDAYCDSRRLPSQPLGTCSNRLYTPLPVRSNQPAGDCIYEQVWWGTRSCTWLITGNIHYLCPEGYTHWATDHTRCINTQIEYTCPPDQNWTLSGANCTRPDQCQPPDVIDPATGQCVHCPVDPLPELPEPKDDKDYACTQSLDKGVGNDVDNACPPLNAELTGADGQMQCLAKKLASLSPPIPYSGPSSTIRTKAYQQHLLDIWDASVSIKKKKLSSAQKQACAAVIANVKKQMEDHDIVYRPSDQEEAAPHVQGIAFDIPKSVATSLKARATMTKIKSFFTTHFPNCISCLRIPLVTGDVQDYINSAAVNPPACNLEWGGSFGDKVHFQLQPQLP